MIRKSKTMKIYVVHSTGFNYKDELYQPLKASKLWRQHDFILPHDMQNEPIHSKEIISSCDLMIAEVSYPSTGAGIELGWASKESCKILCIHNKEGKPSSSLKMLTSDFLIYSSSEDLIQQLRSWLSGFRI